MDKWDVRNVIKAFLAGCGLVYPQTSKHGQFEADCIAEARRRQYITDDNDALKLFIPAGVSMACNAYHHQRRDIQVYICFYTAFLVYLDDVFDKRIDIVRHFNHCFITGHPQNDVLLGHFGSLLLDMPKIFGSVEANVMTTSTLNLVTALSIEHEVKNVKASNVLCMLCSEIHFADDSPVSKLEPSAHRFPAFSRAMAGAAETFSIFVFPPEVALSLKLQSLPDCALFVNNGNDILSFYKEHISGDLANQVSLASRCRGVGADVVLNELVSEAVMAHCRVLMTLAQDRTAIEAYKSFSQGYVGFHAGLERYRLSELGLHDLGDVAGG